MPAHPSQLSPHPLANSGRLPILRDMGLVGAAFLLLSLVTPMHWLTDFAIFCILVLSFDLLYGYMGRLSFGHMLYYGVGTYAASLALVHLAPNPFLAIGAGILASAVLSSALGFIVVRTEGATFALVNLALNQIGFWLAMSGLQAYTRGEDGLSSSVRAIGFLDFYKVPVAFGFMLVCLVLVFGLLRMLTRSPFGILIRSIKENEDRVRFLGYDTFRYKLMTFVIASTLAGFAGTLHAIVKGFVAPGDLAPLENARIIFAVLIGGAGNLYGAIVGGLVYELMVNLLATNIPRWEMFLGIMLLVLVFWFRRGITGYVADLARKMARSREVRARKI